MAIVNNGTKVSIKASKLPTGYTKPTVTEFTDGTYKTISLSLTVAKSTVENASNSTTMAALVAAITAQVDAILAADYIATQTVTNWTDLTELKTNYSDQGGDDDWLNNTVPSYVCTVTMYVKVV